MSLTPVPIDKDLQLKRKADAEKIREIADLVENGDVTNIVIAYDDVSEGMYCCFTNFNDRWKILAALEYAKNSVHHT